MKSLDLENFGLLEMTTEEMNATDGGGLLGALVGFAAGAAIYFLADGASGPNGEELTWFTVAMVGAVIGASTPL